MIEKPVIGFLEESPGVRSMTRLVALLQAIAIVAMSLALAAYLLGVARPNASTPDAGVIAAFGAPLAALAAGVWTALRERTDGGG